MWRESNPIGTADQILAYLNEAAEEEGIKEKIIFQTNISNADFTSSDNKWHLTTSNGMIIICNITEMVIPTYHRREIQL